MRALITALSLGLAASPVWADELALLIGNDRYAEFDRVSAARGLDDAGNALERAGVEVIALEEADRAATYQAIRTFSEVHTEADALAVVLVGRFGQVGDETWFLPTDAEGASAVEVASAGVPMSLLTEMLGEAPGAAILVLGTDDPIDTSGIDLPQGVTLATATPREALSFVEGRLADPGARITGIEDVTLSGFVSDRFAFIRGNSPAPARPAQTTQSTATDAEADYWRLTQSRDNADAYAAYLQRYPEGRFAADARDRLGNLTQTPDERNASAEEALNLSREARQSVQRDLSALSYDTRGVDGIFGSGTRGAIRGWQQNRGFPVTGYLTSDQVAALGRQGAERREAQRAQDDALWADMGQERSEAELQAYLERFPGGFHADEANRLLGEIRTARAADAGATERERQIWRATRSENSAEGYRRYITAFPDGEFVAEARAAIAEIERQPAQPAPTQPAPTLPQPPQDDGAAAAEAQLGLTPITRRAVETRLSQLGFNTGAVDGAFDANTRNALRRYQSDAGLPATGYVNQITAVRLLADTLRDVLR